MVEGHLENLLVEYYQQSDRQRLSVMHERTLAEGVRYYVEKHEDDAFHVLVQLVAHSFSVTFLKMALNNILLCFTLYSKQAEKTKQQLKEKKLVLGTDKALFRQAFEQIREERSTDPKTIIDEV